MVIAGTHAHSHTCAHSYDVHNLHTAPHTATYTHAYIHSTQLVASVYLKFWIPPESNNKTWFIMTVVSSCSILTLIICRVSFTINKPCPACLFSVFSLQAALSPPLQISLPFPSCAYIASMPFQSKPQRSLYRQPPPSPCRPRCLSPPRTFWQRASETPALPSHCLSPPRAFWQRASRKQSLVCHYALQEAAPPSWQTLLQLSICRKQSLVCRYALQEAAPPSWQTSLQLSICPWPL